MPDQLEGANISRSVARLRPRKGLLPQFLAIALEAPAVQRWLRAQHRGIDMPVLNLSEVRLAPIPIAPIEEQAEVVRRVEILLAFADRLEAHLRQAQTAAGRLTPALLAKAFRGELVPQDPSDEPAKTLLERIAAAKQAPSPARKGVPSIGRPDLKPSPKPKLLEVIDQMPKADFSFDELRQVVGGDYESLKADLFELLSDNGSGVEQFFDLKVKSMKLRRARK